eukprot:GHVL01010356.1.p1 GENE.GHVL01010356.1~~GHVL01010356.1.p1  ORF type:complete len:223 (-),score=38.95 GHVL01010356.1:513-1181(-)
MSNFAEFGELVLLIGDFHIPTRKPALPKCFVELLNTDKIRHVLCTGNLGSESIVDKLKSVSDNVHIVGGDYDCANGFNFPSHLTVKIGGLKIGLISGHEVLPWGDSTALMSWQRKLDCDILVSGHTHVSSVEEKDGKYFINPGSASGCWLPCAPPGIVAAFMLMAVQNKNVIIYTYEEREGKANVVMHEFHKPDDKPISEVVSTPKQNENIETYEEFIDENI